MLTEDNSFLHDVFHIVHCK